MDIIDRKADELRQVIRNSMQELVDEDKAFHNSKIQELEQRLSITLEREERAVGLKNSYMAEAEAQRRAADKLEAQLVSMRRSLDEFKAYSSKLEGTLNSAFGTTDYEHAKVIIAETQRLHIDLRRQIAELESDIKAKDVLLNQASSLISKVANVEGVPLVEEIRNSLAATK